MLHILMKPKCKAILTITKIVHIALLHRDFWRMIYIHPWVGFGLIGYVPNML
jgi:hypothetical protein